MIRSRSLAPCFVAAFVIRAAWCNTAAAQTWTWTGESTTSSDWSDPANWSPARVPDNDGTADLVFRIDSPRDNPTHGAWVVHRLTFQANASHDILGAGPITFRRDPTHQFAEQPLIAHDGSLPNAVRGGFVVPADVDLQARAATAPLTLGNATGSRMNGGGGARGGDLLLNTLPDRLTFMLDNAATSPADRGLHLASIQPYTQDPQLGQVHGAHLTIVAADPDYTGTGSAIDVSSIRANVSLKFQTNGVDGNSVGFAPTMLGALDVYGDQRAAGLAREAAAAPRVVFNGPTNFTNIQTLGNVTLTGGGNDELDALSSGRVRVVGTTTFGSAHADASKSLVFNHDVDVVPAVAGGATAVFDPTLGATGDVTNRRTEFDGTVRLQGSTGDRTATLVFRSSANVTSGSAMRFDGTIAGSGTVRFDAGSEDIFFTLGSRISPGEFGRAGDLRFQGTGPSLANFFTPERLRGLTGPGTVGFRRTDSQPFDLAGNVWSDARLGLTVTDSNPAGVDARLNTAGGTHFTGSVMLEQGAAFDVAGNSLAFVGGVGTLAGPATYGGVRPGFASQGGLAFTESPEGISSLTIDARLTQGPLEYGRIHLTDDLALVNADGAPTRLNVINQFGGIDFQELTIVSLDAGAILSGEFAGLPDGARIISSNVNMIIHYNVDGGDGSANDVVLTVMPEPAAPAFLAGAAALLLRRRKRAVQVPA